MKSIKPYLVTAFVVVVVVAVVFRVASLRTKITGLA
jgi:hypothetical protein